MNREKTVSAAVCTIGDEILIGQITDTNSAAISRELGAAGVRVTSMVSIGDRREEILKTLTEELKKGNGIILEQICRKKETRWL